MVQIPFLHFGASIIYEKNLICIIMQVGPFFLFLLKISPCLSLIFERLFQMNLIQIWSSPRKWPKTNEIKFQIWMTTYPHPSHLSDLPYINIIISMTKSKWKQIPT
jgi:hypothetical protein